MGIALVLAFAAGVVVGVIAAWLGVSAIYFEALQARGIIDGRGRWVRADRGRND